MLRTIQKLCLFAVLLCGATTLTSCDDILDAIFGPVDNPATNDDSKDNSSMSAEEFAKQLPQTQQLLDEAQNEGSVLSIYFTYEGVDYVAHFKKVGDDFVLLKPSEIDGGSGGKTRSILTVRSGDGRTTVFVENNQRQVIVNTIQSQEPGVSLTPAAPKPRVAFSLIDNNSTQLQAVINTETGQVQPYSKDPKNTFNGVAVNGLVTSLLVRDDLPPLTQVIGLIITVPRELTLHVGEEVKVTPQISPADAEHGPFEWIVYPLNGAAADFVTIDDNGTIKANSVGKGTIKVQCEARSSTLKPGGAIHIVVEAPLPKTITVSATDYSGTYDGNQHTIALTLTEPTDATVKYGTTEGEYTLTSLPAFTDAGKDTVYYEVSKEGYTTVTGSAKVDIAKADGSISYATDNVKKTVGNAAFINTLTKVGDGKVTYSSSDTKGTVATINAETGQVTIVGAGTATITATVVDGKNYAYTTKSATYTLTVVEPDNTSSVEDYNKQDPHTW